MSDVNSISKVKILVVGDSGNVCKGVGKSSLVHLIHGEPLTNSPWTIGCSVEVGLHEFREGTPSQITYFAELWDVGGNRSHAGARHVFYGAFNGVILVHDLTNRKSQQNLHSWLSEVILREYNANGKAMTALTEDFDAEQFGGFAKVYGQKKVPVLVVGTKQDQVAEIRNSSRVRTSAIAHECSADEIYVNCLDVRSLTPGSGNALKLSRFFDKVIERQLTTNSSRPDQGTVYVEQENFTLKRSKSRTLFNM